MWVAMGEYADLSVHDVIDEIMDMAATKEPGRITLQVGGGGGGDAGLVGAGAANWSRTACALVRT